MTDWEYRIPRDDPASSRYIRPECTRCGAEEQPLESFSNGLCDSCLEESCEESADTATKTDEWKDADSAPPATGSGS